MTRELWQADLDDIRERVPTSWSPWVARNVLVIGPRLGWAVGHASIVGGRMLVSTRVLGAPAYARRALVAAAWGRVVRGHLMAVIGALACFGAAVVLRRAEGSDLVGFVVASGGVLWLGWLGAARRAREVEEVACRVVGATGFRAGKRWWTGSRSNN